MRGGMGMGFRGGFNAGGGPGFRGGFRGGFGGGGMGLGRGGFQGHQGGPAGRDFNNDVYADYNGGAGAANGGMQVDQAEPNQQIYVRNVSWHRQGERDGRMGGFEEWTLTIAPVGDFERRSCRAVRDCRDGCLG